MQWLTPEWTSLAPTLLWLGGVAIVGLAPQAASAAAHPVARLAGLTTYPLYLLHFGLGLALMGWLVRLGAPPLAAIGAAGAVLLVAAGAVARYAEPAVRAVLRRGLDRVGLPDPRRR
jgi:peptidoglycan/LPS O-acetylase OafA/YrhL